MKTINEIRKAIKIGEERKKKEAQQELNERLQALRTAAVEMIDSSNEKELLILHTPDEYTDYSTTVYYQYFQPLILAIEDGKIPDMNLKIEKNKLEHTEGIFFKRKHYTNVTKYTITLKES